MFNCASNPEDSPQRHKDMKKIFFVAFLLLLPAVVRADEGIYPWQLSLFGGGASLCDEAGCFSRSGAAFGASFGRQFTPRWSFELDGTIVPTKESSTRFDVDQGFFTLEQTKTRIWGGGTFLGSVGHFGSAELFIALGFVGAGERRSESTPLGIPN